MTEQPILNKVEHHLLSMQADEIEPLFILFADTKRDLVGTTLDQVLQSLIKLINMGFSECIQKKGEKWEPCKELTLLDLKSRFEGQSEEAKLEYPMYTDEYYFKITPTGKLEESREIYEVYYPHK